MKRTGIFPILALLAAVGLLAAAAIRTLGYFSAEAAAAEQRRADYQASLQAAVLAPADQQTWQAADFSWKAAGKGQFFAAPANFTERYRLVSAEGVTVLSDTGNWDESRLKQLYAELTQNRHGSEIENLDAIFVCSGHVKFKDDAVGEFVTEDRQVKL
jgi:hypothetical protein